MEIFIIFIEFIIIIISISAVIKLMKKNNEIVTIKNEETIYTNKPLMTQYEYKFYKILKKLEDEYIILPQLNLASVVKKINNNKYYNELFRNIDFAVFTKDYQKLLLLIEINDKTHNDRKRIDRDLKVQKICNDINVPLIKFYTNYPNEPNYVINRILNIIKKD